MPVLPRPHVIDSTRKRRQPQPDNRPRLELPLPVPQHRPAPPEQSPGRGVVEIDYTVDFVVG